MAAKRQIARMLTFPSTLNSKNTSRAFLNGELENGFVCIVDEFRKWHETDEPTAPHQICYQGQSGKDLLDASISPFN